MEKIPKTLELPGGGEVTVPVGEETWIHEGPHGSRLQYTERTHEETKEESQLLLLDVLPGCTDADADTAEIVVAYPHASVHVWVKNDRVLRILVRTHRDGPTGT
jgi:hypothetical protein